MAALGLLCQSVYFFAMDSLYQCVLMTFSLSIVLIYVFDYTLKNKNMSSYLLFGMVLFIEFFICNFLPKLLKETDFEVDYGFVGVLLPVCIYLGKNHLEKLVIMEVLLVFLGYKMSGVQWYALLCPLLIFFYNGKRGKFKLKNVFYIYYPLHLVGIYLLSMVIF